MRRMNSLIRADAGLLALASRADELAVAQTSWNNAAPEALRRHTRAGHLKQQCLTVYADSGAIAAKIKLLLPTLIQKLQNQGLEVTSIRVEVQVKSVPRQAPRVQRQISQEAASSLTELAESISDPALAEALMRLARHSRSD